MKSFKEEIDEMKKDSNENFKLSEGTEVEKEEFGVKYTLGSVQCHMRIMQREFLNEMLDDIGRIQEAETETEENYFDTFLAGVLVSYRIVFGEKELNKLMIAGKLRKEIDGNIVKQESNHLSDCIDGLRYPETEENIEEVKE